MKGKIILKISLTIAVIMFFVGYGLAIMVNPIWLALTYTAIAETIIVMIWVII